MTKDWPAVAAVIRNRMQQLDMTQAELIQKSGLAPMTIREMINDSPRRRRSQATLAAVSEALGWPRSHLKQVLDGGAPRDPDRDDPILRELAELRESIRVLEERGDSADEVRAISSSLDRIEQQLTADDESP